MTTVALPCWGLVSRRDATCRVSRRDRARFLIRHRLRAFLATGLLACAIGLGAELPVTSIEHRVSSTEFQPAYFRTGVLTLEDRIWAQTQIERVYYNHRIWPKENPGPKPPFETMVPEAVIEEKVVDSLKKSAALDLFWLHPISPEMLQAELDRTQAVANAHLADARLARALGK